MASSGFFLGGAAEGMKDAAELGLKKDTLAQDLALKTRGLDIQQQTADQGDRRLGQDLDLRTRALNIQEQAQKNAENRAVLAKVDTQVNGTMDIVNEIITTGLANGRDPNVIAKTIQPMLQSAKSLAAKGGIDPSSLDIKAQAWMAGKPTGAETATAKGTSEATAALAKSKTLTEGGYVDENDGFKTKDEKIKAEGALRDDFVKITADFAKVRDAKNRIDNLDKTGAGDMTLVFQFMKMLDPGSTVREGEYATAANSGGVPSAVMGLYNKALGEGSIGDKARTEILGQSNRIYGAAAKQHEKTAGNFKEIAKRQKLNPDNVVVDMTPASGNQSIGVTPGGFKFKVVK